MPTYYFDVLDDGEVVSDDEGIDFTDLEAARGEATKSAREQIANAAKQGLDVTHQSFASGIMRAGRSLRSRFANPWNADSKSYSQTVHRRKVSLASRDERDVTRAKLRAGLAFTAPAQSDFVGEGAEQAIKLALPCVFRQLPFAVERPELGETSMRDHGHSKSETLSSTELDDQICGPIAERTLCALQNPTWRRAMLRIKCNTITLPAVGIRTSAETRGD
jgi:hypothetical protein